MDTGVRTEWDRQSAIRKAIERLESRIDRNPAFGRGTQTSTTTLCEGLRCCTMEGPWQIATDLPVALGGDHEAPSPATLARAALGSCLAMMYAMRAARHGVAISSIRVTVESDTALEGMIVNGSDSSAGWEAIHCHVDVVGNADADQIMSVLDEADAMSPMLDLFQRANAVARTVAIHSTER